MSDAAFAQERNRDKNRVALSSVVAASALTGLKLAIGLLTNSLGILAEAAHSALDLVAAIVTCFAVRVAERPADREHPYGHGKVENLSAMFETFLLLVTCGWIVYEAGHRLLYHHQVKVEVTLWSFTIMIVSIVVDFSRSRMLMRAAKKYESQALEADALHFSTDIWSSAVVIVGLIGMKLSAWFPAFGWMHHADAISALIVALIVVWICIRLGRRTILALMDTAPAGMEERVTAAVEAMPGVRDCHHVRIRYSGAQPFVDVHVTVPGAQTLESAHQLTEEIEKVIEQVIPHADVTVHPEPFKEDESRAEGT